MDRNQLSGYVVLLGRILYAFIFILASLGHFSSHSIGYAAARGVPMATLLVPLSGVIGLLGGVSILLGYRARIGAWLIVLFLVPITFMIHNFWTIPDPKAYMIEQIMFLKNLSMLGAALMITYFGSGPMSLSRK